MYGGGPGYGGPGYGGGYGAPMGGPGYGGPMGGPGYGGGYPPQPNYPPQPSYPMQQGYGGGPMMGGGGGFGAWGASRPAFWVARPHGWMPPTQFNPYIGEIRPAVYYIRSAATGQFVHIRDFDVTSNPMCDWDKRIYLQDMPGPNTFAMRDADNGRILGFDGSGRIEIRAQTGPWETVQFFPVPGFPGRYFIFCQAMGRYLRCEPGSPYLTQSPVADQFEQFELIWG